MGFIDSGVDANHPQIKGLVIAEKDFTGEGPGDSTGHGTLVVLTALASHLETSKLEPWVQKPDENHLPGILMAKVVGLEPIDSTTLNYRLILATRWLQSYDRDIVITNTVVP